MVRDLARAFYLRTGQPVHKMTPPEISNDLLNEIQPVGASIRNEEDQKNFIADADDADGELPPVRVLLRWPSETDPGGEALAKFLAQWSQIFRVAVSEPNLMLKGVQNMSLPSNSSAVLLYKSGATKAYTEQSISGLPKWLLEHATETGDIFDPKTYLTYLKMMPAMALVMLLVDEQELPAKCEEGTPRAIFIKAAKQFRGQVNAVTVLRPPGDGGKDRQAKQRRALGLKQESGPVVAIMNGHHKHAMLSDFSHNAVVDFIKSYLAGKLPQAVASADELDGATVVNELLNTTIPSIRIMSGLGLRKAIQVDHRFRIIPIRLSKSSLI